MILIFIVLFIGFLIFVHELGHFYAARMMGVKVEEFSIGFGKKVYSRVRGGIRYSIRLLPLGGFVKMYGEHGEGEGDPRSFISKPAWRRLVILMAGVFMNALFGWIFFSASAAIGIPQLVGDEDTTTPVSIIELVPGAPADEAGLRFGDKILVLQSATDHSAINPISEDQVIEFTNKHKGTPIIVLVRRGEENTTITVTPRAMPPPNEGPLGIALARINVVRTPIHLAPIEGGKTFYYTVVAMTEGFGKILKELFTSGRTQAPVSGPVGIYFFAHDIYQLGLSYFLQFGGIISVNLAFLNVLPIPILDGGWVLLLAVEKLKGSRVSERAQQIFLATGFALLGTLMIVVTYLDLVRNGARIIDGIRGIVPF